MTYATASRFQVIRDGDDFWVVDADRGTYASAGVATMRHDEYGLGTPLANGFGDRDEALEQCRRITVWSAKTGRKIQIRTMFTNDRFETVADTVYGCAW